MRKETARKHFLVGKKEGREEAFKEAAKIVSTYALNYPIDIFPLPTEGSPPDCYSAQSARYTCKVLSEALLKLK